ncbi:hypothetical protein Taro_029985 [Colocasia esculenta]|uniref:Uncharacterized protein n=1 Tax=Colocasia esculenta TaxID=4460 RepID=A0A843VSS4_COLES|nr:hypothetical protein [Colocasia esculenta]
MEAPPHQATHGKQRKHQRKARTPTGGTANRTPMMLTKQPSARTARNSPTQGKMTPLEGRNNVHLGDTTPQRNIITPSNQRKAREENSHNESLPHARGNH